MVVAKTWPPAAEAGASDRPSRFGEHSLVSLARPLRAEGRELPLGARGSVVAVYRNEAAYEVEFRDPFPCVLTVEAPDLKEA